MVQRKDSKIPNNPSWESLKLSALHHDLKICRGAELKKKMMMKKKSGKTKQPEPNYMKATSSSEARKEKSQVSFRRTQTVCSNASKKGQNNPSLKFVRALTKAPSFKPVRARSSVSCSNVALCDDLDVQRATCSSTLKESKFPCFLELSPGATESQGSSAMKVCSYSYCSLNGHSHLPLPPLKSFMSARRRSLKAQRSFKITCLSPRGAKTSALSFAEDDGEDKQEVISSRENIDFSIDIYCKEKIDFDGVRDCSAEESGSECLSQDHDIGAECESNQQESEDSELDMECEGLDYSAFSMDSIVCDEKSDLGACVEDEVACFDMQDESALKGDEKSGLEVYVEDKVACFDIKDESAVKGDDFIAENILPQMFDEESMTSGAWLTDDDDTESSISCTESNLCEIVGVSDEDDDEITQSESEVSDDESSEELQDWPVPHEDSESNGTVQDFSEQIEDQEQESANEGIDSAQEHCNVEKETKLDMKAQNDDDLEQFSLRRTKKNQKDIEEDEEQDFNPRGPNFLPLEPDPEAEKVDLKHQTMDERKNAEEWMVDYALRQTVSKLAPARRKKVALLVEAFETVSPVHSTKRRSI